MISNQTEDVMVTANTEKIMLLLSPDHWAILHRVRLEIGATNDIHAAHTILKSYLLCADAVISGHAVKMYNTWTEQLNRRGNCIEIYPEFVVHDEYSAFQVEGSVFELDTDVKYVRDWKKVVDPNDEYSFFVNALNFYVRFLELCQKTYKYPVLVTPDGEEQFIGHWFS